MIKKNAKFHPIMTIRWECKCVWRLPLLCLERETFGETICSHLKSPLPKPCSKFQILPVKQSTPFPSVSFIQKLQSSKTMTSFPYQVPTPSPSSSLLQASLPPRPSQLCLQLVPSSNLLFLVLIPSSNALFVDIIHSKYQVKRHMTM